MHVEDASQCDDRVPNFLDGVFQGLESVLSLRCRSSHDVQRRGDQVDLDGQILGGAGDAGLEAFLDGPDPFVSVAGDFDVGTDLDGLLRQFSPDDDEQRLLGLLVQAALVQQCRIAVH